MKAIETTGKGRDGSEGPLSLAVQPPSGLVRTRAQTHRAKAYGEALDGGARMRQQIHAHLRRANLVDDEMEARAEALRRSIVDGERLLETKRHPDGSPVRLKQAREVALGMARDRARLQSLQAVGRDADAQSADALADQAQFNYFVAACTVYRGGKWDGKPYFTRDGVAPSVDAYLERADELPAREAASALADLLYGTEAEIFGRLPEYVFLRKYNFVDERLRLIDEAGNLVDELGRRVNEDGRLVDADGRLVDADGNLVDEEGRYVADEGATFVDDDGNPVE